VYKTLTLYVLTGGCETWSLRPQERTLIEDVREKNDERSIWT